MTNSILLDSFLLKIKKILPDGLGLKMRRPHQNYVFNKAILKFRNNVHYLRYEKALVKDLVYGWGNPAFSSLHDYAEAVVDHSFETKGPVLECGSGLSTVLIGIVAEKKGFEVWSLEHNAFWGRRTRSYLDKLNIQNVHLHIAPLKDYGEYEWYQPPLGKMPDKFRLVICDGPPEISKGGRYGLFPIMSRWFAPGSVILLDDIKMKKQKDIVNKWQSNFPIDVKILGTNDWYAKILFNKSDL